MAPHRARRGSPDVDDVLDVARALLDAHGTRGLTVRALAEQLGVSRQVVASRFGSKQGLLEALYADGFSRLAETVRGLGEPGTDAQLIAMSDAYRSFARSCPAQYALMFMDPSAGMQTDEAVRAIARHAFEVFLRASEAWCAAHAPATRPIELAQCLWAGAHGVVALEGAGHLPEKVGERVLRSQVKRMLDGTRG